VTSAGTDRVARTVTLPSPAARVWRALVEPERLSAWLGGEVELEPRVGGRVSMVDEKGEYRGMVEVVEDCRRLVFRLWAPPARLLAAGGRAEGLRPCLSTAPTPCSAPCPTPPGGR
jgi:uncharacterized protein YndB with AHSA1/START domain